MPTIVKRTEGRYEAQEVEFGTVYRWCPECVVIDCDCGERVILSPSMTTCSGCDTNHAAIVQEELVARQLRDEIAHPWRFRIGNAKA